MCSVLSLYPCPGFCTVVQLIFLCKLANFSICHQSTWSLWTLCGPLFFYQSLLILIFLFFYITLGVLLFSVCISAVLPREINHSSLYLWVSTWIFLSLNCKYSCLPDDIYLSQSWVLYSPHSILLLQICFLLSVCCVVTCCTLFRCSEGECDCLALFHTLYMLLHQVVVPSKQLLSIPSAFFSMSHWVCPPLAYHLIPKAARPDDTYICLLTNLDVDLFSDDNEGVQAICDYWGVMQEALMVSFSSL